MSHVGPGTVRLDDGRPHYRIDGPEHGFGHALVSMVRSGTLDDPSSHYVRVAEQGHDVFVNGAVS